MQRIATWRAARSWVTRLLAPAVLSLIVGGATVPAAEDVQIPKLLFQPSVNLVLSVGDVAKSKEFYGDVLGLKPMANLNLPGGFTMTRYQVGTTEIKFLHNPATQKTETGRLDAAIGIRRLTLFLPDQRGLSERFAAHGLPAPRFAAEPGDRGWPQAVVADPDGSEIALVVPPKDAGASVFDRIELRLTVSDLEKSRRFYRDFVGFAETQRDDPAASAGGKLFEYAHGNTVIQIASFGKDLPVHTGRWEEARGIRYIQYIVRDLDAVNRFAVASGVTIAEPIFPLGKLARIMFVADPDGVINEFVGLPLPTK
jgi:catechol 2,3-dioxygenase-like lactoylglutathione lyase family enzyme